MQIVSDLLQLDLKRSVHLQTKAKHVQLKTSLIVHPRVAGLRTREEIFNSICAEVSAPHRVRHGVKNLRFPPSHNQQVNLTPLGRKIFGVA